MARDIDTFPSRHKIMKHICKCVYVYMYFMVMYVKFTVLIWETATIVLSLVSVTPCYTAPEVLLEATYKLSVTIALTGLLIG